ncbi:MAG: endonuclease Q family protein [Candidatus Thorarchaeota archaeon]
MQKVCDLHIHSKFSGGASKYIDIFRIALNSGKKGIDIVGTGDCLHPSWLSELKVHLVEYAEGMYFTPKIPNINFVLQTEIEVIWREKSHLKKVHFIILFPNFEKLEEASIFLNKFGNLDKDGRAKIYCSAEKIIFGLKSVDNLIEIIPAHIFTPFFGILGDKSQFKNLKEAIGSSTNYIHAVETGLSADPIMIRKISELNDLTILSNSDSHSTCFHRLGREASLININKVDYSNLIQSIRKDKIIKTYEFKPSAGKYYYDGHRKERHNNKKNYFCSPNLNMNKCPYCGKNLTKGVLSRICELSDQKNPRIFNFQYVVPLLYLITVVFGGNEYNKKNIAIYEKLISNNGNEFNIWEGKSNFEGISEELIEKIIKIRKGEFWYIPGHDANYGKLQFNE